MKRRDMQDIALKLMPADQARSPYAYVPFDVPDGTTRIDVTLDYPKAEDCVIDLGCVDPRIAPFPADQGFRGWSGGARDRFFIATDDATPGYIHGEIPPGRWQVMLGLYKLPVAGADIRITVSLDNAERSLAPQPARSFPVREGAGWYRGDLHCHTFHSDARGAPEVLHAAARQAGLDFLAVADHNTITQRRYFHRESSPDLVFVRAMEVTTAIGHANVFGVDNWIDFRMETPEDAHRMAEVVHRRGGLLSINHDKPTIPWDYPLPEIELMEVWQSAWPLWNWISLSRWQERLASGLRISAIGGSDYHQPERLLPEGPLVLARPTTVLWMDGLCEDNILKAMKAGRGYVTESPTGPHLEITIGDTPMGGAVLQRSFDAEAIVRGAKGDCLVWYDATGEIARQEIAADEWRGGYSGSANGFVRAEIIADKSRPDLMEAFRQAVGEKPWPGGVDEAAIAAQPFRRALSNPIYLGIAERSGTS
ncbi:CehA/McbA family metallohydrolase [Martelella mediterranea]|nr:CehA/McbA family metallohydrolase [Martelella mediterranea]